MLELNTGNAYHMPVLLRFQLFLTTEVKNLSSHLETTAMNVSIYSKNLSVIMFIDAFGVGNDINNAIYLFLEINLRIYKSCCPDRKKNISRNRVLKPLIRYRHRYQI